jgi:restriction endonuclease S subunit
LIIPSSGETALEIATVSCVKESGVLLGGDLNVLRFKEEQNGEFFAYYLKHFKNKEIAELAQGHTVVHLYASSLKSLKVDVPALAEQKKIAEFLVSLDSIVESKQKQITEAEQWKKGLMQQLFV